MRLFLSLLLLFILCTCARAQPFECHTTTPDGFKPYTAAELAATKNNTDTLLPTVYMEVDYDITEFFGGVGETETFIRGAFAQVAFIYRRDVTTDPQLILYIHESPTTYVATSSYNSLLEFRAAATNHPGNVAMLLSFRASGGIAFVDQVCGANNYAFSSIRPEYAEAPIYSWTVNVIGHELGHLLGSLHTQSCVWNGNNTPLDDCFEPEGDCVYTGPPITTGSMMSYCHLQGGVQNSMRILPQPAAVMRARMIASGCVASKPAGPTEPEPCTTNEVTISFATDLHPRETSWTITNEDGTTVATSPPYQKDAYSLTIDTTICLDDGCYLLTVTDPDGIASDQYGYGSLVVISDTDTLSRVGAFTTTALREFCLGNISPPICDPIALEVFSYGTNQDVGTVVVSGTSATLTGNAWKALHGEWEVTPETIIELEMKSPNPGQIIGVGFDDNEVISSNLTFQLGGYQNWGINTYSVYPQQGGGWYRVSIPVGQYYTGTFSRLTLVNDNDVPNADNVATFKNIVVHNGQCGAASPAPLARATTYAPPADAVVADLTGRVVNRTGTTKGLRPGIYFLSWMTDEGPEARKVVVH